LIESIAVSDVVYICGDSYIPWTTDFKRRQWVWRTCVPQ